MPNGYEHRKYGKHEYSAEHGTSDCIHKCGCWMGPCRSDGPLGLDPFGECPNNPLDGKPLRPGKTDYEDCVTQRIRNLESRAHTAEKNLKKISRPKKELFEKLEKAESELSKLKDMIANLNRVHLQLVSGSD